MLNDYTITTTKNPAHINSIKPAKHCKIVQIWKILQKISIHNIFLLLTLSNVANISLIFNWYFSQEKLVSYGNPVNPVTCICDGTSRKKELTENWLEYNQKKFNQQTLMLEHNQKFTPTNINL